MTGKFVIHLSIILIVFMLFPTYGLMSDQLTIARCRSHCISKLRNEEKRKILTNGLDLNDRTCSNVMDCNICWDHCYNLVDDWDKWSPVCVESQIDFCRTHLGCKYACAIMSNIGPTSNQQRLWKIKFLAPKLSYFKLTKEMKMIWKLPMRLVRSKDAFVAWVFFQEDGRPWQPLLQTLNTSIQIHVTSQPDVYSFCVLIVDRHGVVIQSPVVKYGVKDVLKNSFKFPSDVAVEEKRVDPLQDQWRILLADLKVLKKRLGTPSNLTKPIFPQMKSKKTILPILLGVTLAGVALVVVALIGITCYFQRYQSKQLAEMRASFHAWSGRLGSSFRSSLHMARRSFRRRSSRSSPNALPPNNDSGVILSSEPV